MADTKALCIFANLLGNKAMSSNLIATLNRLPNFAPTYVCIDGEDYRTFPAPRWTRATAPWELEFIARQKARQAINKPFDLLLVHGWEMAVAFRNLATQMPAAAMMDAVPATIDAQRRQQGFKGWKRRLSHEVHHRAFAKAAREFDLFLPKGSDCADSLVRDYGIPRDRCFVTLVPQDLEHWTPGHKNASSPIQLLFVGNDFARKGGEFLLRLYAEHLSGKCSLTLASNDPTLEGKTLPPGVQWLRGRSREQLLDVYRASDIFVFPTQQDYTPQVLGEALAAGLPCLVCDLVGVRDLVRNGETGFLIPHDAPTDVWAAHVKRLIANPGELSRMSACARRYAEDNLGLARFESLVAEVVDRLRSAT